jgi:hypothetical protein
VCLQPGAVQLYPFGMLAPRDAVKLSRYSPRLPTGVAYPEELTVAGAQRPRVAIVSIATDPERPLWHLHRDIRMSTDNFAACLQSLIGSSVGPHLHVVSVLLRTVGMELRPQPSIRSAPWLALPRR